MIKPLTETERNMLERLRDCPVGGSPEYSRSLADQYGPFAAGRVLQLEKELAAAKIVVESYGKASMISAMKQAVELASARTNALLEAANILNERVREIATDPVGKFSRILPTKLEAWREAVAELRRMARETTE